MPSEMPAPARENAELPVRAGTASATLLTVVVAACTGTIGGSSAPAESQPDAGRALGTDNPSPDADVPVQSGSLRVAVISDLNGSYGSTSYSADVRAAVDRIIELQPDVVLSTGDMVAGQQAGLNYRAMWSAFHGAVSDRLDQAGLPLAVTPGNHDASGYSSFAQERSIFVDEWSGRKPDVEWRDDSDYPLRYSFRAGHVLFVSLDATTVGALGSDQMQWLSDQLAEPADVKIVYGHLPIYPFTVGRETEIIGDPALEDLLAEHDVDLFVSGHHHAYYPGRRPELRVVSMACLGSGPRALIGTSGASGRSLLLIDIDGDQIATLDALAAPDYQAAVDRIDLPTSVGSGGQVVHRDDL